MLGVSPVLPPISNRLPPSPCFQCLAFRAKVAIFFWAGVPFSLNHVALWPVLSFNAVNFPLFSDLICILPPSSYINAPMEPNIPLLFIGLSGLLPYTIFSAFIIFWSLSLLSCLSASLCCLLSSASLGI